MPDQSLHAIAPRLRRPRLCPVPLRLPARDRSCCWLRHQPGRGARLSETRWHKSRYPQANERSPPSAHMVVQQWPNGFQPDTAAPAASTARDMNTFSPGSQPWPEAQPERLAQNPASPEIIRPGVPAVQGTQPPSSTGHRRFSRLPSRHGPIKALHRRSTRRNSVCRRLGFRRDWAPPSPRRRSRENTGNSSSARSLPRTRSRSSSAGPK